jgi:Kinesin motor domain
VRCTAPYSFLELHNEDILDLLSSGPATDNSNSNSSSSNSGSREDGRESLQLRENIQGEVVVTNLSQHEIHSAQELGSLLARGALQRATARYTSIVTYSCATFQFSEQVIITAVSSSFVAPETNFHLL